MRHATVAAIESGCECDSCRLMARVYANRPAERARPRRACSTRIASTPLEDGTVWGAVIRELLAMGHAPYVLARFAGVGDHTITDLAAGKRKVRAVTVPKLRRLLELLPSEKATG